MAQPELTPESALLEEVEEAIIVLFCLIDDTYRILNPKAGHYESLKQLSDSEVMTLALLQQLRGVESERSFLRDVFEVLLAPVSWGRRALAFFLAPQDQEVASFLGAFEALCSCRSRRRPGDPDHRLDFAFGFTSEASSWTVQRLRIRLGRNPHPSAGIVDSQ